MPNGCVRPHEPGAGATVHDVTEAVFDLMSRRIARRTDLK
jgi:hypothetical protein